jgi:hypothetical protein
MSRFLALGYALSVVKLEYKPPTKAIVPRRPALLRPTPDPVNARTRPTAVPERCRLRAPLCATDYHFTYGGLSPWIRVIKLVSTVSATA